jgi:hypothetical protein
MVLGIREEVRGVKRWKTHMGMTGHGRSADEKEKRKRNTRMDEARGQEHRTTTTSICIPQPASSSCLFLHVPNQTIIIPLSRP